ncbi:GNAT family N-acetyltransferase [Deminuibacter soli]|uniref:GNAT family N-acetyltransferase n=1 Tax=Deminuibacter soli TaxID=2291815 RepID=A0A3E1NM47_9BACT|nr:GNAT family N-acetyltransferase [Deminuibacter soli]RFM28995.1 GNAT family N-acetyltransferase [Deminuibacter soli]
MTIQEVPLADVWRMRKEVMYPAFTIDQVKLEDDEQGLHLGLYEAGTLISVVSLFQKDGALQFRKFATVTAFQGKGYGSALLQHIMQLAMQQQNTAIWCNARTTAVGLYKKFGMYETGATWHQHGHEFIKMEKQLGTCK